MTKVFLSLIVAIALMLYVGCSGTGANVTLPGTDSLKAQSSNSSPACLGAWQIAINKITGEVNIYQSRSADLAINVLGFLEPPALVNLSIDLGTLLIEPDNNLISVDVLFRHPIPDPVFNGFDVRGIVFGPDILNADGYTPFMNPDDFEGVPFGYQDGLLGAPNSLANYSDELNGYKYFCDDLDVDDDLVTFFMNEDNLANRGVFTQGTQNGRHMDLSWEGKTSPINFFVFNYAVYANYDWPVGDPPIDLDNFSITSANAAEPFCFNASASENSLYFFGSEGGGELTLDVEIWDWQGFDNIEVAIEAPEFGGSPIIHDATSAGSTSKSRIFTFTGVAGTPTSTANVKIMVTATDESETFGSYWFLDLLPTDHARYDDYVYSVWFTSVPVSPESPLSFTVETDAPHTLNTPFHDRFPGIITNNSGTIYIGHMRTQNDGGSLTYTHIRSTNSGSSWITGGSSFGTGGPDTFRDTSTALDALGRVYWTAYRQSGSLVVCESSPTSGIYTADSIYGSALIFTHDGYCITIGDNGNQIRCKVNDRANTAHTLTGDGAGWLWNDIPTINAVPSPARLSRVDNTVRNSADAIYFVYFSSTSTDTWIRMAYNSDGTGNSWTYGNTLYDGATDGYDVCRDPSLFLDGVGIFHSAFIAHTNTPTSTEKILYTTSSDGLTYATPVVAYEVAGSGIIQDATVKTFDLDGTEVIAVLYQENNSIYLAYSSDDGVTWDPPTLLSGTDVASYPDMTLTDDDYVHVCWENNVEGDLRIEYIRVTLIEN